MELTGKVIKVLPLQSGEGKNGIWKKQEYVIETESQYPKKVCFSLWGDKIEQTHLSEGEQLNISFDLESREFNGRWYTEVRAWKIAKTSENAPQEPQYNDVPPEDPKDDLPF